MSGSTVVLVAAPDGDAGWGLSVRGTVRVLREMAPQAPLVVGSTEPDGLAGLGVGAVAALPDTPPRGGLFRRKPDPAPASTTTAGGGGPRPSW